MVALLAHRVLAACEDFGDHPSPFRRAGEAAMPVRVLRAPVGQAVRLQRGCHGPVVVVVHHSRRHGGPTVGSGDQGP